MDKHVNDPCSTPFKRYCKTLTLYNDEQLIEQYKQVHAPGAAWPEITQGMKEVGILDMQIYLLDSTLFMIMDTVPEFDHERDMARLANMPRQAEWEAYVSQFQRTSDAASAAEKWRLMEKIYQLEK